MSNTDRTDVIAEELNETGDTVQSYFCENLMAKNTFNEIVVPYYYEFVYPCAEEPSEGRDYISAALLSKARTDFLPDGTACSRYQDFWFGKLSSLPEDQVQTLECTELIGACCAGIAGSMTFTELTPADPAGMKKWVASKLNEPNIAPAYQVAYINSEPVIVPQPAPVPATPPPPAPSPDVPEPPEEEDVSGDVAGVVDQIPREGKDNQFTMVGILILIGMILIFVTVVLLIFKRRRKYLTSKDVDEAIAQSEIGHGGKDGDAKIGQTTTWEDQTFDDQDLDMEANIWDDQPHVQVRSVSSVSYRTNRGDPDDVQNSSAREPHLNQMYRFDLAESFKNNVMGAYGGADFFGGGPTQIPVVPPYPMEETSESEAEDSWAQSDGFVGSLDDDHGRIETTSEIGEI